MSDNPNYVTPEEAFKKICPLKATSDIDDVSGQCVSHECMAWRWKTEKIVDPVYYTTPYDRYSTTHGRCGMVPL
jgi:hypothetical protein